MQGELLGSSGALLLARRLLLTKRRRQTRTAPESNFAEPNSLRHKRAGTVFSVNVRIINERCAEEGARNGKLKQKRVPFFDFAEG